MDSERFGRFTASLSGNEGVFFVDRESYGMFLPVHSEDLPHLEQALAWAKARLATTSTPPDQRTPSA